MHRKTHTGILCIIYAYNSIMVPKKKNFDTDVLQIEIITDPGLEAQK
jgi:hypothetical protein